MTLLAALLAAEENADAFERMLLAALVHPEVAGCEHGWLLLWNPRARRFHVARQGRASHRPGDLRTALARARHAVPSERGDEAPAWSTGEAELDRPLGEAWTSVGAVGVGGPCAPSSPWGGAAHVGAVALQRDAQPYGLLVGTWADAGRAAAGRDALSTLRAAADPAIAAHRQASAAHALARRAHGAAELTRTSVSAINLAEALHLVARLAAQGLDARGAVVYRTGEDGRLSVEVAFGVAGLRDRLAESYRATAQAVLAEGHPRGGDAADAPEGADGPAGEAGVWAAAPFTAYGRPHGVLLVYGGPASEPGSAPFDRAALEHLGTLADHIALLVEHAKRIEELRASERARHDGEARMRELEGRGAIADLAARVAHESRNPLAAIAAFARRAQRDLAEEDPRREYMEVVLRECARLEGMLAQQQQYADLDRPHLKMQGLNAVLQAALQQSSETLVRRRVRLLKKLSPDLPQLLLDAPRIQRVVENVLAYALECVPTGGRMLVESRRSAGVVVVEIAHDGGRAVGELMEQLFVPFAGGAPGGAAVGLSVAQQIVREHGGEVRVRSEGEWGTVFAFTLPVLGNEDRRHGRERRGPRNDRRGRDAA